MRARSWEMQLTASAAGAVRGTATVLCWRCDCDCLLIAASPRCRDATCNEWWQWSRRVERETVDVDGHGRGHGVR